MLTDCLHSGEQFPPLEVHDLVRTHTDSPFTDGRVGRLADCFIFEDRPMYVVSFSGLRLLYRRIELERIAP